MNNVLTREEIVAVAIICHDEAAQLKINNGYETSKVKELVGIFEKLVKTHDINEDDFESYNLRHRAEMRKTTPVEGDWIVLERYPSGKVMRAVFIQDGFHNDETWVEAVLKDGSHRFELLHAGGNDYREWELVEVL